MVVFLVLFFESIYFKRFHPVSLIFSSLISSLNLCDCMPPSCLHDTAHHSSFIFPTYTHPISPFVSLLFKVHPCHTLTMVLHLYYL